MLFRYRKRLLFLFHETIWDNPILHRARDLAQRLGQINAAKTVKHNELPQLATWTARLA